MYVSPFLLYWNSVLIRTPVLSVLHAHYNLGCIHMISLRQCCYVTGAMGVIMITNISLVSYHCVLGNVIRHWPVL